MELLQEYDFDFKYKRGVDNIVPDALSRRPDHRAEDTSTPSADSVEIHSMDIELDPGVRQRLIEDYKISPRLSLVYNSCLEGSVPTIAVALLFSLFHRRLTFVFLFCMIAMTPL
jgi:hypothetical protein